MPQYFFAIRAGKNTQPERVAVLKDDAAAFAHACDLSAAVLKMVEPWRPIVIPRSSPTNLGFAMWTPTSITAPSRDTRPI
jgi:hypothetical protein